MQLIIDKLSLTHKLKHQTIKKMIITMIVQKKKSIPALSILRNFDFVVFLHNYDKCPSSSLMQHTRVSDSPFFLFCQLCSQKYLLGFIKQEKYNYINMKSESQKKTCTAKMVIKVTVGTKMRGKVMQFNHVSDLCSVYLQCWDI